MLIPAACGSRVILSDLQRLSLRPFGLEQPEATMRQWRAGMMTSGAGVEPVLHYQQRSAHWSDAGFRRWWKLTSPRRWVCHASDYQLIPPNGRAVSRDEYLGMIGRTEFVYDVFEPASDIAVRA
jgi:hypothetical protein